MLASDGYPKAYKSGFEISLPATRENEDIFVAGAKKEDGKLKTAGGRVLGAVATAENLERAIENAYKLAKNIHFENAYMRLDIGRRALMAKQEK